jgi:hypothetical protein
VRFDALFTGKDESGGGPTMIKVRTFATPLRIFHTKEELDNLDKVVNQFIQENDVAKIVSVSDTCTTDDRGSIIGIIRVIAYE